jgi:hypothetical protein
MDKSCEEYVRKHGEYISVLAVCNQNLDSAFAILPIVNPNFI